MIPVFKPALDSEETDGVISVLKSRWIGNGPVTKEFEKKFLSYIGGKYCVAVNSASAAIHLSVISSNVKQGDEVITPSLTFVATNHPILMQRATPVFCDVDYDTLCSDPSDIEKKITKKTKAIVVVHYGGHPVDIDPILKLCEDRNIMLIEDCAHASGSYYKDRHVGIFGDFSAFSFAAIKNLTTGDGGMIVGRTRKSIESARTLAWSGISESTWERVKGKKLKWQYNVVSTGWKYQMNDIAAAIGLAQLKKLESNNLKRKKITQKYNSALKDIPWIETPTVRDFAKSSYHNYVIKLPQHLRDRLSEYLAKRGVTTTVHYMPSHYYSLYKKFSADVPVTNRVWKKILLLPIYPDLMQKEQDYIIDALISFNP
ncbi:MAG: hypothetical protein A2687_04190 [Candidatus Levybacteria bacterium RIFCSPHIGHO2_01_FULL_38_26]|nr:MAG: hypothetical protein A2687_04190 [Candidatus Levybacteria bacterium RIFCSPHIGHO2_01_FULL_38_26]